MLLIKRSFLLIFTCAVTGLGTVTAQSQLNRISLTERGDGNGYVIRYHLTRMVDSFDVAQPELNRIQMQLFSSTLDSAAVDMPEVNSEVVSIELVTIDGGLGVDIRTGSGVYFLAEAYPDQNQRDLLLNLEYTTQQEAEELASAREPFVWSVIRQPEMEQESEDEEMVEEHGEEEQPAQRVRRRPGKISFGFAGGIGIANKIGGGYTSEARQEMTMGLTASIDLPFRLPYSIEPGIETGIFYTQKGFQNPSGEKITAQTVVLDYIEIPVMGKLRYDLNETVKPYGVGGLYTAFRTAAETIRDDGDRGNIGDETNNLDVGLIAGLGSEFVFSKATISLQIRGGFGLPRMFKEGYSGAERPAYLSLLVGFQF